MTPEPFPDDISNLISRVLSGGKPPELDEQGRYTDGTYKGMTPQEVEADRAAFRRIVGE